jgi:uncharacterized protein YndB with AHSA1/START domain
MNSDQIVKQILLRAPLERVWRAISDSSEFGSWFGMKVEGPFVQGENVRASISPTTVDPEIADAQRACEGMPFEVMVVTIEPEKVFAFRWHPYAIDSSVDYSAEPTTLVTFELQQEADGVMLTVTESGFDQIPIDRRAKAFTANEQGWSIQVRLIEAYLAQLQ